MSRPRQIALRAALAILPAILGFRLLALTASSEDLTPRWLGDRLLVSAPKLHFLTGKPLERLRNGVSVPFDFQLAVSAGKGNPALQRALERFVVSYDLWEEKFTVVQWRNSRRSSSHLSAAAAEAWCLENLALPTAAISSDRSLWVKLEIRSAESKGAAAVPAESAASLAGLIEVFSRPGKSSLDHWAIETGPFKLTDLRR